MIPEQKKTERKGVLAPVAEAIGLAAHVNYGDDAVVSRTLIDQQAGTLTLFAFDAGQGLSEHTAPFDATVQVLDGEGEFIIAGKSVFAKPGELVIMPAGIPHSVRANQRFKMLLIMIRQ
ncbi:MAG: cupin domain-containing protein [Kiritimatiellaeota bacterium]|nr:cupin domain-containing protein [Kiritimatiellota bacterium]